MRDRLSGVVQVAGVFLIVLTLSCSILGLMLLFSKGVRDNYDIVTEVTVVDKRIDSREETNYTMVGKMLVPRTDTVEDYILTVDWSGELLDIKVAKIEYDYYDKDSVVTASINSETKKASLGVKE